MKKLIKQHSQAEKYFEERCYITELINEPATPAFSLAKARVLPGITTALHSVDQTTEVYYILEGQGEILNDGGIVLVVEKGDTILIPAGEPQNISNTGNTDLLFLCICTPRFVPDHYRTLEDIE